MGSLSASRCLSRRVWLVLGLALCPPLGCADEPAGGTGENAAHADVIVDALSADPDASMLAINGVRGGGAAAGSTDVLRLGYTDGVDNAVTLRWSGRRVFNGPGADLVVFENAFAFGDAQRFMDLVIVEVSRDGQRWVSFPHDYRAEDETAYSSDPGDWVGFAGRQPVLLHEEANRVDPFDGALAGGDAFDLAALPAGDAEADAIRSEGFAFLRLVTAPSRDNPDTGLPFARDVVSDGADIDGVYARYLTEDTDATEN